MTASSPARTLVLQSTGPKPPVVIRRCLDSVSEWAKKNGHAHRLLGDELFEPVPDWAKRKFGAHPVVLSDLARLQWIKALLAEGWERVLWLDSDVFVFAPEEFVLPGRGMLAGGCAFGRELWVEYGRRGELALRRGVHNAASLFDAPNAVLDFYIHACERILARHAPNRGVAPQLLGPKFLSAQHNILDFDLIEAVGMASPLTLAGLAGRGGAGRDALTLMQTGLVGRVCAVNLCLSYLNHRVDGVRVDPALFTEAMDALAADPGFLVPSRSGDLALQSPDGPLFS